MKNEKTEKVVRVLFYVQDDFRNPRFFRKSHIGYLRESDYKSAIENCRPVFALIADDYLTEAKRYPETITG